MTKRITDIFDIRRPQGRSYNGATDTFESGSLKNLVITSIENTSTKIIVRLSGNQSLKFNSKQENPSTKEREILITYLNNQIGKNADAVIGVINNATFESLEQKNIMQNFK